MASTKAIYTLLYSVLIHAATALQFASISTSPLALECLNSALSNSLCVHHLLFQQNPTLHHLNACLCANNSDFISSTATCLLSTNTNATTVESVWNRLTVLYENTQTPLQYSVVSFIRQATGMRCEADQKRGGKMEQAERAVFQWVVVPKYAMYLGLGLAGVGFAMYFVIRLVEGGSFTKWSNAWRGRVRRVYKWAEWHGD